MKPIAHPIKSCRYPIVLTCLFAVIMVVMLAGRQPIAHATEKSTIGGPTSPASDMLWQIQTVDSPKYFGTMSNRSLALDSAGHPHLVYGGRYLYHAWHDGTTWHTETVDGMEGVGERAVIAIDGTDTIFVAYWNPAQTTVRLAVKDDRAWRIETVEQGGYPSLTLDTNGRPHLSYAGAGGIRYARWDGSAWEFQSLPEQGAYPALALDSADQPHISFRYDCCWIKYARRVGNTWEVETASMGPQLGDSISLSLDQAGQPHIIYVNDQPGMLRYAYRSGGIWESQTVDATTQGSVASLILDHSGQLHISYTSNGLVYAYFHDGIWEKQVVKPKSFVGYYSSLVLDAAGNAVIGYRGGGNLSTLSLVRWDGSWETETVDTQGSIEGKTSLVLDSTDQPYIAYTNQTGQSLLRLAEWKGSAWQQQTVNSIESGNVLWEPSLILDQVDHPRISYGGLGLAEWTGDTWVIQQSVSEGGHPSLALNHAQQPCISYYNYAKQELRYAYWDQTWITQTVDSEGDVGYGSSLALDSTDRPHIAYSDFTNLVLKYAQWNGGNWEIHIIDSNGVTGFEPSLKLDSQDRPHIAYLQEYRPPAVGQGLKYAYWNGTDWEIETVDDSVYAHADLSLALDQAGQPHISYYDRANADLRYAYRDGSEWKIYIVDTSGDTGQNTSLALDNAGHPHISYTSLHPDRHSDLKYAVGFPVASHTYLPVILR